MAGDGEHVEALGCFFTGKEDIRREKEVIHIQHPSVNKAIVQRSA